MVTDSLKAEATEKWVVVQLTESKLRCATHTQLRSYNFDETLLSIYINNGLNGLFTRLPVANIATGIASNVVLSPSQFNS